MIIPRRYGVLSLPFNLTTQRYVSFVQNCSDNDPNTNVALLRSDVGTLPVATPPVLSRASSYGSGGTAYSPRSFSQFDNSGMDQKASFPNSCADFVSSNVLLQSNRPASSTKGVENQDVNIDRTTLIATLPLPPDPPANTLSPIMLPSPITLNEFLNNTPGVILFTISLASHITEGDLVASQNAVSVFIPPDSFPLMVEYIIDSQTIVFYRSLPHIGVPLVKNMDTSLPPSINATPTHA